MAHIAVMTFLFECNDCVSWQNPIVYMLTVLKYEREH